MKRWISLALFVVSVTSLFAQEPKPIASATAYQQGTVTVISPNEPGWQLVKSEPLETIFTKRTKEAFATASARTLKVTRTGSAEDLLADLEARRRTN